MDYHKDFIIEKNSDQGPWGGMTSIFWKSNTSNAFTENELIEFANKNEWILLDSISFYRDTLTKKSFSKLKIDPYSLDLLNASILPKVTFNDHKIFIFKTTWLTIEPGNTRETFANGFGILNSNGNTLKIFHFWGD